MSDYKYQLGLYLGRFQPIHKGHTSIIDQMLDECESIVIAVGSAQERGTERNPLGFFFRRRLIIEVYFGRLHRIKVLPIFDRTKYSDDSSWGEYLLGKFKTDYKLTPDVIYEGDEVVNTHWYDGCDIPVVRVPRYRLPITGTDLREAIKEDRKDFALSYMPPQTHKFYDEIRKDIQNGTAH